LKRITGDCDDLTVLYNSLLETVGIQTGFITTPGHIYSVFNTKIPSRTYNDIHPDRKMTINVEGDLWVPIEITMIGKSNFLKAWREGVEEWETYEETPEKRGFFLTRDSQELYRPVGLKETDLGLQYGNKESIVQLYRQDMGELVDLIVGDYSSTAQKSGKKEDYNKLGIAYAKFAQYSRAEQALKTALRIDPNYTSALANLGNIAYLQGDYKKALTQFNEAYTVLKRGGRDSSTLATKVLLNISRTHYEIKEYNQAKEYFDFAKRINPAEAEKYAYIGGTASEDARAAEASQREKQIIFIDENE
jgi:tetratricopeptide (TPR) repeat protein